ncbi:hypothetical protein RCL1_007505 [Eukaryota sp. TZLM3-RCL]
MNSNLALVEDPDGHQYYKNIINRSLSNEETSLLTSLKHPNLVGYWFIDEQETNKIIFDYCEFGLFSDLDLSKLALYAHDLWSIRNQILQALKYLASHALYHNGLNVSNVLVYVLIGSVNTEIPIQDFWKQKMNEQEEVCFDELIRSIVKSVFPYSIIDKNIVFTNPNTLERNDLESLKALICSIESETMFKSGQCIGDFSSVNNNFSCIFKSFKSQQQKNLFLSQTLLFHVFIPEFLKFGRPLLKFDLDNSLFECRNKDFSTFATKLISTSFNFRNVFFRAFDSVCSSSGHCLDDGITDCYHHSIISSRCYNTSQLSTFSVVYLNWLKKFPITSVTTFTLNFDTEIIDKQKITNLELDDFHEELSAITFFPNLSSLRLSYSRAVHYFSILACCCNVNLRSISIIVDCFSTTTVDLTPFSNIEQLCSFSVYGIDTSNISPLSTFKRQTKLELNRCNFTDLSILSPLQKLQELSLIANRISDISTLSSLKNLGTFPLSCLQFLEKLELNWNKVTDISPLASLENLVDLSICNNEITDLRPLSSLVKLERLSLLAVLVFDLWPLKNLTKLSFLDLRETLVPREHQRILTNSSDIKALINSFEHGVFDVDFSNYNNTVDLFLYSHCSRFKSLNLCGKEVENISEISKFTNLETLDLSNVTLCFYDNNITDIFPLSSLQNLTNLCLFKTKVSNLSSLQYLSKLSFLDVRETLLPQEHQQRVSGLSCVQEFLNYFAVQLKGSSINHLNRRC